MDSLINGSQYLNREDQWDELAYRLRRAGIFGLDSEFYNVDVRSQSCVGRATIHVWSVAIRTRRLSPLGYHVARGWVLPVAALQHPGLRAVLEDPTVRKCVHNQAVDDHAFHNHGVNLRGCINTLGLARWVWPELITAGGFGLKNLMAVQLHRAPICEYLDVVTDHRMVTVTKTRKRKVTRCFCGEPGCRRRKGHAKTHDTEIEEYQVERNEEFQYPLESIVPGHVRHDLLVRYAAEDAIAALEVHELAVSEPDDPAPFVYTDGERPEFSQDVEDEVVIMERTGFRVDTTYAAAQCVTASNDEARELRWLRRWFRLNCDDGRPDAEVNAIWSSQPQLVALFDSFGFPRSPVWKKGRVKPGKVKLDGTALEWIARNCDDAKEIVGHLLHLKRIRSCLKYLQKLANCGGFVNPICGPAGDADDRNGAVTGRLGIKGVLEAQQLPTREEVDLYQIRKAIIA